MIQTIKKIIKTFLVRYKLNKLYRVLYAVYIFLFNQWVKISLFNHQQYALNLKDNTILFDLSEVYSKRWFYPFVKSRLIYEPALSHYLSNTLMPTDCFIDVGAHIGYFTCIAANQCQQGEVHAFEIEERCICYIEKNVRLNQFKNIAINNVAVSDSNEPIKIIQRNRPNNKANIFSTSGKLKGVQAVTLDDYVTTQKIKPAIIKIDVEGAEIKVLRGMKNILQANHLTLLIEVHGNVLTYLGFDSNEIVDILFSHNFNLYELVNFRNGDGFKKPITSDYQFTENMLLVAEK